MPQFSLLTTAVNMRLVPVHTIHIFVSLDPPWRIKLTLLENSSGTIFYFTTTTNQYARPQLHCQWYFMIVRSLLYKYYGPPSIWSPDLLFCYGMIMGSLQTIDVLTVDSLRPPDQPYMIARRPYHLLFVFPGRYLPYTRLRPQY